MNQEITFQPQAQQEVSSGDWMITLLLTAIPLVGFIMLFVWGFGSGTPASKANWAKATLIWMAIWIILVILGAIVFGGMALLSDWV